MNWRLGLQSLLLAIVSFLPIGLMCSYIAIYQVPTKGQYEMLLVSLKAVDETSKSERKPYERLGLLKQIWFQPLENGALFHLEAESSQLSIERIDGRMHAKEHLHNVFSAFQDQPSFFPSKESDKDNDSGSHAKKSWALRLFRSNQATFDYTRQLFEAERVALEFFRLDRALDLSRHRPPESSTSLISGHAERVHIDLGASPPSFRALRFRAFINPSSPSTIL